MVILARWMLDGACSLLGSGETHSLSTLSCIAGLEDGRYVSGSAGEWESGM